MIGSHVRCLPGATKALFLLAFGSLSPMLWAQGKVERELAFVRGLARQMGLVSLANAEVARLEREYKSASDQDRIQQIAVEVSLYAAKLKSDREAQRASYKQALDRSKELVERTQDASVQSEARATMANAAQEFGQFLIEELDIARSEDPERVKELETEAGEVFRLGVEACTKVMADLEAGKDKDEQKKLEYGLNWLRKGVLQREHGRAVPENRGHLVERAKSTLLDLVLEYGEETTLGLRGLFEIAQCDEVAGDLEAATSAYRSTIEQIATALNDAESLGLSADTAAFLFNMMQEVYAHLADLLFEHGDVAGAASLFASFRENLQKFGEKDIDLLEIADPRYGHLTFLTECRFLAESGDAAKVQQALAMVQKINDLHPSDYVGIKAKAVLRDILAAQQSLVSGRLLYEIALGEYQNKNYEEAIKGFRHAVAAMKPPEAAELGLKAYDSMGRAFRFTNRYLESVIAFQIGLDKFAKKPDGTEHPDASDVADRLDQTLTALKAQTRNDPALRPIVESAEPLVLAYSVGGGSKIHYKNGYALYTEAAGIRDDLGARKQKFADAAAAFAQVTPDFLYYEQALARVALAFFSAGEFDQAMQKVTEYRTWLQSKDAVLDPKRTDKQQVRDVAIRQMDYTEALVAYVRANGDKSLGIEKDLTKYPAAIEKLRAFIANYGKSPDENLAGAIEKLGRLHTDLGELDKANAAYVQLKPLDEPRASALAATIFAAYLDKAQLLEKELDAAASGGKPTTSIEQELKATRTQLTSLGLEYMRTSPQPQIGILANTLSALEKLQDWKRMDEVAQRTLALYGDSKDKDVQDLIDLSVRPKVGLALLQQEQFQRAYEVLLEAEKAYPNNYEVKALLCRALGGWFTFSDAGRPVVQPGLGKYKEAYDKYYGEVQVWALRKPDVPDYSLEWYRFHWNAYWYALQAGKTDTKYKGYAETLFRKARSIDNFARLESYGAAGKELSKYFNSNRP